MQNIPQFAQSIIDEYAKRAHIVAIENLFLLAFCDAGMYLFYWLFKKAAVIQDQFDRHVARVLVWIPFAILVILSLCCITESVEAWFWPSWWATKQFMNTLHR